MEVQTKELEGGVKLTFMKFIFVSPGLEIKAPVLNDKQVGFQVDLHHSYSSAHCSVTIINLSIRILYPSRALKIIP